MNQPTINKRQKILDAALRAFAKYGFEKATIKQIAREAGLSTTSLIYWYFKDKNELFQAVLGQASPLVSITAAPAALMERTPEEVLPIIARTFLDTFDDPDMVKLIRIFFSEAVRKPETSTYFAQTGMITVLNFLVDYQQRQVELGRLRPHDYQSAARSFIGTLVIYIMSREIFPPLRADLPDKERYVAGMTTIFLRGLRV
jgi:AcrR family transcriptional regulator